MKFKVSILVEFSPGFLLLAPTLLLIYIHGAIPSMLPLLAVLLSFLAASLVARRILPKTLGKLYSWRLYEAFSPLFLLPPLLLLLQTGYEYYSLWYEATLLKLVASFMSGLVLFLIMYPILRRF